MSATLDAKITGPDRAAIVRALRQLAADIEAGGPAWGRIAPDGSKVVVNLHEQPEPRAVERVRPYLVKEPKE